MKYRPLSARGFAHHVLLVFIVVGVAIVGSYALIVSHADTCGTTDPVTNPVSGSVTGPDSCPPVSYPVTGPDSTSLSCTIDAPTNPAYGTIVDPLLTVTNHGTSSITPGILISYGGGDDAGHGSGSVANYTLAAIDAGKSYTVKLSNFDKIYARTVDYSTPDYTHFGYDISNQKNSDYRFQCTKDVRLPQKPVLTASCTLLDVPASVKRGGYVKPKVSFTNTGNVAIKNLHAGPTTVQPNRGNLFSYPPFDIADIAVGKSKNKVYGQYLVGKTTTATKATITVHATLNSTTAHVTCSKSFTIKP